MTAPASADGRFASSRYAIYGEIASGGMATVHFGRLFGNAGFSRTVAIKRLHPQLAKDPEFVAMFMDEANVTARIRHPNVVSTLDVVSMQGEIFIVMEYVLGESLWKLLDMRHDGVGRAAPPPIAAALVANVLHGLHAAHEATSESGDPLAIVHRDVSPQNIIVGKDGVARVLDFGIAKARDRIHVTRGGTLKGKVAYMAPEQLAGKADRRTDVYAAGVVLWEALTGRKLFVADGDFAVADKVRTAEVDSPNISPALDAIVMRAIARAPDERFATANEMAVALEREVGVALPSDVGAWVVSLASQALDARALTLKGIEQSAPRWAPDRAEITNADPDPDGLAPTRAIDVGPHGEVTEVSLSLSASLSKPARPMRVRSSNIKLIAVASLVAFALGLLGVVAFMFVHRAPQAAVATASVVPDLAAPIVATTATPTTSPIASSDPVASAPSVATATSAARVHPLAPVHADPCKPPYVIDSLGIRRLKHECLR